MGTRGAYGFVLDGKTVAAYNHFDSYPSGLGRDVIQACRITNDWAAAKSLAAQVEVIDADVPPTPEQIAKCKAADTVDLSVSNQSTSDWYCLLRKAQGDIAGLLSGKVPYMDDGSDFLKDSLFCEFAYLINFDDGVLEVYKGFNKDWGAPGRYAALAEKIKHYPRGDQPNEFAGVALVDTIPLTELTDGELSVEAFIHRMERACGMEEEES